MAERKSGDVTEVEEVIVAEMPPPEPKSKRERPPSESKVLLLACDWLEATNRDNLPELSQLQEIRIQVTDRNLTLAWQMILPIVEERRGDVLR